MTVCPHCQAEIPASARFCPGCAHAVSPDTADATRTSASPHLSPSGQTPTSDSFDHGRFAPGTLIGERYRIVARLGVGGMGEVYRADDLTLGQAVALKFLPEAVERDAGRLDKFTAEVRTARQIAHPNVCRVYDVGEAAHSTGSGQSRRFLTMEYVDGEDLQSLLRRIGRFQEDKGLEIARQICAGLAAMHDRGVLHRDLKPANIMIDGRGRVRLTDFGLATDVAGAGTDGEIAGTPAYMAPEQFAGQPLTPATDLYALGLVLFELFTGERVQQGKDVHAIRSAQHTVAQTLTTSGSGAKLDPLVQRVVERCLDPDPKRRPQSAAVIAAALPGGDPLAAALAAGETPSPQMVAAAGEAGGLSYKVAIPLLLTVLVLTGVNGWVGARSSDSLVVPLPYSPEVLASKAKDMLGRLGYAEQIYDEAYRLRELTPQRYQGWLDRQSERNEAADWRDAADVKPALRLFWYRVSPVELRPFSRLDPVDFNDPPQWTAGMTRVELDAEGRLASLDALPPAWVETESVSEVVPDWKQLFDEAGLDISAFTSVEPRWISASAADTRSAWVGPFATPGGAELRVEAAMLRGRPVFFRMLAPWTPRPSNVSSPRAMLWTTVLQSLMPALAFLGLPLVSVFLARHNLARGRADTRGALRIAVALGVLAWGRGLLGLGAAPPISGWLETLSWPVLVAALAWLSYVAIEPYVRRSWPTMLVGWSRLIDGRWRDPQVGRELLIGCALAPVAFLGVTLVEYLDSGGILLRMDLTVQAALLHFVGNLQNGVSLAFGVALLLIVCRLVFRTERRTLIAVIVTIPALAGLSSQSLPSFFATLLLVAMCSITLTRVGLLAVTAQFAIGLEPDYFALPTFAIGVMVTKVIWLVAPAIFGFYIATRGRNATAWLDG